MVSNPSAHVSNRRWIEQITHDDDPVSYQRPEPADEPDNRRVSGPKLGALPNDARQMRAAGFASRDTEQYM